jgi:hypothetical protein
VLVIARSARDEAIQRGGSELDCFAALAMMNDSVLAARNASEVCDHQASAKTTRSAKRGEGSGAPKDASNHVRRADKRIVQIRSSAFGAERAADRAACAAHLLSGRARLPAHRCGSRAGFDTRTQLQAMLPGRSARRALPAGVHAQFRDSTSRRGRSTAGRDARRRPGAVCETARRRRIPLRNQDRIRNAPLDERDSLWCVIRLATFVNK